MNYHKELFEMYEKVNEMRKEQTNFALNEMFYALQEHINAVMNLMNELPF